MGLFAGFAPSDFGAASAGSFSFESFSALDSLDFSSASAVDCASSFTARSWFGSGSGSGCGGFARVHHA